MISGLFGPLAIMKYLMVVHLCSMLFSLVSYITGFKNSLKGVGYLVGAAIVGVCAQFHLVLFLGIV